LEARLRRPPSETEEDRAPGFAIYIDGFAPVYVTYCPFCGTRLDGVGIEILSRYRYKKAAPRPTPNLRSHEVHRLPPPTQIVHDVFFETASFHRPRKSPHRVVVYPIPMVRMQKFWKAVLSD
jgi:hypothetical protein